MRHKPVRFSQEEDVYIANNYNKIPVKDIAEYLGRGEESVKKRASKIGATRPLRRWSEEEDQVIIKTWKAKGGMSKLAETLGRRLAEISVRAKKLGCSPWRRNQKCHSGRPVDGFVEGRPIYTHRRIIEEELGRSLSPDEIVHHIDGDITNNERNNLCLLKNRFAHLTAHRSYDNLLPELIHRGYIRFDADEGVYKICEMDK